MKTCLRLLLVFIIIIPTFFLSDIPVHAKSDNESFDTKACGEEFTEITNGKMEDYRDNQATIGEEYTIDLIEIMLKPFELNTLEQLLFGNPFCTWFTGDEEPSLSDNGLFPTSIQTEVIEPMLDVCTSVWFLALCLSMMISGLKLGYAQVGQLRINMGEELVMYLSSTLLLIAYWLGIDYVFQINNAIVTSIGDMLAEQGIELGSFSIIADQDDFNFTDIIILVAEWIIMLFLNLVYLLRLFLITILLILGGFVIVGLLFDRTRKYFGMWLKDFVGAVFMQSIHALYFAIVIMFVNLDTLSIFFKLILLFMFLPISSMMLSLMGMSTASMTIKTGQSLVNTGAKAVGAFKSINRKRNSSTPKGSNGKTVISTIAEGSNSKSWGALKTGASLSGAFVGATAGMAIGGGGASLGGALGSKVASSALQVPRNVTAGIKGIMDTRGKVKNKQLDLSNISDKRQYYGSMGESFGAMFGKGDVGRKVGYKLSGISNNQILSSIENGGLGGVNLSDILQKYPQANIQFQQTNEGSGFYLDEGGKMQLISPLGEADITLPSGVTRVIDYEPNNIPNDSGGSTGYDQLFKQASDTRLVHSNGNSFVDNGFDASSWRPEQHCNVGTPSSLVNLTSNSPFNNESKGGEA